MNSFSERYGNLFISLTSFIWTGALEWGSFICDPRGLETVPDGHDLSRMWVLKKQTETNRRSRGLSPAPVLSTRTRDLERPAPGEVTAMRSLRRRISLWLLTSPSPVLMKPQLSSCSWGRACLKRLGHVIFLNWWHLEKFIASHVVLVIFLGVVSTPGS